MKVVGAQDVLVAPESVPGGRGAHHPDGPVSWLAVKEVLASLQGVAEAAAAAHATVWIAGPDPRELGRAADLVTGVGADPTAVVLECPWRQVEEVATLGHPTAVCPDDEGAAPEGALEAVVVAALAAGASYVRTSHTAEARRAMDVAAALATEAAQ